jgi:diguanylate cyclase (GGDEF)-like protein
MSTEQIMVTALAVIFLVAVAVIFLPRIRHRRSKAPANHAVAMRAATGTAAGDTVDPRPTRSVASDAGDPVFRRATGLRPVEFDPPGPPATTDDETGLDLQPAWARWLSEEQARVRRFHRPATIVLVELSGLDHLADRLGDEAAHRLIAPIATTMRRQARATDHLARLGRTTFGAILTETDAIRAINYVERIRSACDVWLEAGAVMLRVSIGWSEMSPDRPAEVALPDAVRRLDVERQRTWPMLSRETEERGPVDPPESQLIRDLERLRGSGGASAGPEAGIWAHVRRRERAADDV